MQNFLKKIHALARKNKKRIVFPEGSEERILRAVEKILKQKLAQPILIGNSQKIKSQARKFKLKIDWEKAEIIDNQKSPLLKDFAEIFYNLRKHKGISKKQAMETVKDNHYFGTMLLYTDYADGMIGGTTLPTHETIKPPLQIIKTREAFHKVSGVFLMVLKNKLLLFADTVVTVMPDAHDLVDIAMDTAETAKMFDIKPKIAMLSFSTKGSADDPVIEKIRQAVAMIKYKRPDMIVEGEMQVDAALVPEIAKIKCPDSVIQGDANILIFPNLEAANIAYKLVERLAKAKAIGPIIQGLTKPVNDLSRGCSWQDIVDVTAVTGSYE
ncbi:phosphate acetyltransferase [Candidatus Peregrinibacteria bacterium]|nr:phosphate acetyltransferase [Candidatus Peregrinibacteria bacterium]